VGWSGAFGPEVTGEINRTSRGRFGPAFTLAAKFQAGLNL